MFHKSLVSQPFIAKRKVCISKQAHYLHRMLSRLFYLPGVKWDQKQGTYQVNLDA